KVGQTMLKERTDGTNRWIIYQEYDANFQLVMYVEPNAINLSASPAYDESVPGLAVQIRTTDGLIHLNDYYDGTSGPALYLQRESIQQGSGGTPIKLREYQYTSNTAGGVTVYPLSQMTIYKSDASGGSDPIVTSYSYTFFSGTNQVLQQTV